MTKSINWQVFKENAPLVEEVVAFVRQGVLLTGLDESDAANTIRNRNAVVRDFNTACECHSPLDLGYSPWMDIKEGYAGDTNAILYTRPDWRIIRREMTVVTEHISELLYSQTPAAYREIQFGIADDLSKCADSRAVEGLGNAFWEEMFFLYRSGVWPCGWEGIWPEGRIIVFDPLARDRDG